MLCLTLNVDLSRFDAAPLIAFTVTKQTNYGTETDRRIPPRCGTHRVNQWVEAETVADDLGIGMSTLNKWITAHRDTDLVSKKDLDLAKENDLLRREVRLLKEERKI